MKETEKGRERLGQVRCLNCFERFEVAPQAERATCPFGGVGIDTVARKVIKCELCDGDPTCVAFCQPEALQYLPASTVNLRKKREAGLKFAELMRKFAGI